MGPSPAVNSELVVQPRESNSHISASKAKLSMRQAMAMVMCVREDALRHMCSAVLLVLLEGRDIYRSRRFLPIPVPCNPHRF